MTRDDDRSRTAASRFGGSVSSAIVSDGPVHRFTDASTGRLVVPPAMTSRGSYEDPLGSPVEPRFRYTSRNRVLDPRSGPRSLEDVNSDGWAGWDLNNAKRVLLAHFVRCAVVGAKRRLLEGSEIPRWLRLLSFKSQIRFSLTTRLASLVGVGQ
ncbi:hypothetical protein EA472_11530 [Natrarchaeobius oligotrophus]|uniref:Uncharacterized protein n=1 Tax=Natrarchaeobius chitinivorans TaxID=1679083 RepID=A0A3N6M9L5_NATCH|nr:hypothetical protein EA472_11530 [Natrarchaeobius chitinivorans]